MICRCEETTYAAVRRSAVDPTRTEPAVAKLATRAGLGPCQARICGPTVAELRRTADAGAGPHHRPVAEPISLGELARPPEPPPGSSDPSAHPDSPVEESTS